MEKKVLARFVMSAILFVTVIPCMAQSLWHIQHDDDDHRERIRSMKIAFITDRLSLTPAEAERFWPVYNQYQEELKELRLKHMGEKWHGQKVAELIEEEAAQYAECKIRRIEETARLKRKYHEKFLDILPVKKVALLYEAEKDFNRRLFREFRRRQRDVRE